MSSSRFDQAMKRTGYPALVRELGELVTFVDVDNWRHEVRAVVHREVDEHGRHAKRTKHGAVRILLEKSAGYTPCEHQDHAEVTPEGRFQVTDIEEEDPGSYLLYCTR